MIIFRTTCSSMIVSTIFFGLSYVCSFFLLALGKDSGVRTCSRLNTPPAFKGVEKAAVFWGVDIGIPFLGVTYRGKLLRFGLCKDRLDFFPLRHLF